ncbi:MAG TPA: hypothetical protein DD413_09315 [Ruminococcus sp.]|nr:hypothetical protein [Ruminococcus sp.]
MNKRHAVFAEISKFCRIVNLKLQTNYFDLSVSYSMYMGRHSLLYIIYEQKHYPICKYKCDKTGKDEY